MSEIIDHFCDLIRQSIGPNIDCIIQCSQKIPAASIDIFRRFYCYSNLHTNSTSKSHSNNIYEMLKKGEEEVRRLTGDQIHEMRLLGYCNNGLIEPLPIHPKLGNIQNIIFPISSFLR